MAKKNLTGTIAGSHVKRLEKLEAELICLKEHYSELSDAQSFVVPVETLAPDPFILKRPLQVVVQSSDGQYVATLFDANLGMSGDTAEEAVANLKATIVDTFDLFEENEEKLGPEPKRQLSILRGLIHRA